MYGKISFTYPKLMSVLKPGHPADLLDGVLSMVGWDVFEGKEIELSRVEEWLEALKSFKDDFEIEELSGPIEHIEEYIKNSQEPEQ